MTDELNKIGLDLEALRAEEQSLRTEAIAMVVRLRAAALKVRRTTTLALDDHLFEYRGTVERTERAALASWYDFAWSQHLKQPSNTTPHKLRLGFTKEKILFEEIEAKIPRLCPLVDAKGASLFLCDDRTKETARRLITNLIIRASIAAPSQVRFSLFDPLGLDAAYPMRSDLPNVRQNGRTVTEDLEIIIRDITRINHDIVKGASRLADIPFERRSAEPFEIVAIMDFPQAYSNDPRAIEHIIRIANAGPHAGKYLLIEYRTDKVFRGSHEDFKEAERYDCNDLGFFEDFEDKEPNDHSKSCFYPEALDIAREVFANNALNPLQPRGADWDQVVKPDRFFTLTSEKSIETKLGENLVFLLGKHKSAAADDDFPSHAIVAGQPVSGKSFLLHVLITGIASRYSPDELQFLLVDGKSGVEFAAYSRLPHCKVVCLDASPALALSVLEDFHQEMKDRLDKFKEQKVLNLTEYRSKTRTSLPRLIMIVDEYSVLFKANMKTAEELLDELLRWGRAAGTHLVLSSQTFGDLTRENSAFSANIKVRISMQQSPETIRKQEIFENDGRQMIEDLASGQAIINDDNGKDRNNRRGSVARIADGTQEAVSNLVQLISQKLADNFSSLNLLNSPIVLDGQSEWTLDSNPFITKWVKEPPDDRTLQDIALKPKKEGGFGLQDWSIGDPPILLWLGRNFDVHSHALIALHQQSSHNVLSVGASTKFRLLMIANALAGLRWMLPDKKLEITLLDGLTKNHPSTGVLRTALEVLEEVGAHVRFFTPSDNIETLLGQLLQHSTGTGIVLLSEPQNFPQLRCGSRFDNSIKATRSAGLFKELLINGPKSGIHVIISGDSLRDVSTVISLQTDKQLFIHRVVQQMSSEDSQKLFESDWANKIDSQTNGHPTGSLYIDGGRDTRAAQQLFKSYCAKDTQDAAALNKVLRRLYAGDKSS